MVGARAITLLLLKILLLVVGDKAIATLLLRLGTVVRVSARAAKAKAKAKARLRTLLLVVPLLLLLLAMLLLQMVRGEADLLPTSALIVGNLGTARTRAPNWPLRTRNGKEEDGSYWFWPVLQPVHPQGERT